MKNFISSDVLLRVVPSAVFTVDEKQRITSWNDAAVRITGYEVEEVLGKPCTVFARIPCESQCALLAGDVAKPIIARECQISCRDGSSKVISKNVEVLRDEEGSIIGGIESFVDITDRRTAEKDLSSLSSRNLALLSAIPDIIMEVDGNKSYTWANEAGYRFFGRDVLGRNADFYFEGEQETYGTVEPIFEGDEDIVYVESWQRRVDGEKRLLAWWCRVLKDSEGTVTGALSTARDITEQRKNEDELERSRAHLQDTVKARTAELQATNEDLRLVIEERQKTEDTLGSFMRFAEASLQGLGMADLQGNIIYANRALMRMFECASMTETVGTHISTFYREKDAKTMEDEILPKVFEDGAATVEMPLISQQGSLTPAIQSIFLIRKDDGEPFCLANVITDITEQKRNEAEIMALNSNLEQRVRDRTAQLEASNQELEAFAYSVSHDLRAPLRSIDGFSQAILEDYEDVLDEDGKGYLLRLCSASQKMGILIDDLLKLSRLTRLPFSSVEVDLSSVAREIGNELSAQDPGRTVDFVIEDDLHCRGDSELLQVVVQNLLENAWKFTGNVERALIELGRVPDTGGFTYFVRDNGAGFEMTYVDKLFGPFQRLHRAKEFPGNGIGLATVKRIVSRHGGTVWAEGCPGEGATFFFTLPPAGEGSETEDSRM